MKIFFFYVLLLVFASVDTSGVYISLNGIPVEYPSEQWSNAGTAHVYLQNGGLSSHAFCVQQPAYTVPGNDVSLVWGDEREEEIIAQASSYPPLSYQCQSLPFDDYFDAEIRLKDGVRSYRTQVDFIHHEERSIFSFERVHCFQAPRIELLTSGVNFANNFFRVDEVIKIGCPRFINCFIQEVIITPNQFEECMDFTTQIDGGEAPRYLTAKSFWVNGSLNFQDNMMNLAISNATVTLKTKDLYVPD